jgi:hypothetical protein
MASRTEILGALLWMIEGQVAKHVYVSDNGTQLGDLPLVKGGEREMNGKLSCRRQCSLAMATPDVTWISQ